MTAQKKVYKLDSVEAINFLMDKLDDDWRTWLLNDKPMMEIEVRLHKERRRAEQNDKYWAIVDEVHDQMEAHGYGHVSKRGWDKFFRIEILGIDSDMVDGKLYEAPREHKYLGVHDFSDYLTQVIKWADEHEIKMKEVA